MSGMHTIPALACVFPHRAADLDPEVPQRRHAETLRETLTAHLSRFDDPDADVIGLAIAEKGRLYLEDDQRMKTFELFRWYRLGADL